MALIGYARVSAQDQDLSAQLEALEAAGCERVYHGNQSGRSDGNARKLAEMIESVRDGDTVLLTKLDRMGQSLKRILTTIQELLNKGAQVVTLDGQVDTSSDKPMQKAMTQLLGVFAELEHSITVDRLQSGRERTGKKGGAPSKLNDSQRGDVVARHKSGVSKSQLAKDYGVSRATIMRVVKD